MKKRFEPESAFRELEGQVYDRGSLFAAIGDLRGRYLWLLGPEVDVDDLYQLAAGYGWIKRYSEQDWRVAVS